MVGRPEKLKGLDHHEDKTRLNSTTKVHAHCTCTDTRYQDSVCHLCVMASLSWGFLLLERKWTQVCRRVLICGLLVVVSSFKRTEDSTSKSSGIPYVRATSRSLFSSCIGKEWRERRGGSFLSWAVGHFSLVWWAMSDVLGNFVRQLGLLFFQGEVFIHGR